MMSLIGQDRFVHSNELPKFVGFVVFACFVLRFKPSTLSRILSTDMRSLNGEVGVSFFGSILMQALLRLFVFMNSSIDFVSSIAIATKS